jgi:hypothetical protein
MQNPFLLIFAANLLHSSFKECHEHKIVSVIFLYLLSTTTVEELFHCEHSLYCRAVV